MNKVFERPPPPYVRSMLYVPGNVQRFVDKAAESEADAIILDLEDSVPGDCKAAARSMLAAAVPACGARAAVFVRVNHSLGLLGEDVAAAMRAGADGIVLPKTGGAEVIRLVEDYCKELRPDRSAWIVPIIETAAAVARMSEIARASENVMAMLVGSEDLAAETASASDGELVRAAKIQMVLSATEAGIRPLGLLGSIADYRDLKSMREVALQSKRAGMAGSTCIHPSAVPVLNDVFSPSPAEIDLAVRQVRAAESAAAEGRGSCQVDGRMVDAPVLAQARRILALARHDGAN
jgi:citrate lyase subunit beta / citryl-CoA lyase